MSVGASWAVIILMVILSAFFSASEISFNASNKRRLKKAADGGDKIAALAYRISEDFTSALSAILIGNNLVNIAASTTATVIAIRLLFRVTGENSDTLASFLATVVMTLVILIFGEILPKILAKKYADQAVRIFAVPIRVLTLLLYPLVWLVLLLIRLLSRVWGKDSKDAPTVTEEELSTIIDTVEEEGVIDEDQSELLQSTLEFRDTTVEEIMTPRIDVLSLDIDDDPEEIARKIEGSRYSRIPVYEDSIDHIIGVLYLNHYYRALIDEPDPAKIDLLGMLMEPCFVHKTMRLPAALNLLRKRKTHMAIIVDEFGGTHGIVTMENILEELVGDIWDESEEIVPELVKTGEDTYEVSGDMNIDDFFSEIEFEPKNFTCEYSTVGGWAIERLDADPHVGDRFEEADEKTVLDVSVTEMDEMRVTKVTVAKRPRREDEFDEES